MPSIASAAVAVKGHAQIVRVNKTGPKFAGQRILHSNEKKLGRGWVQAVAKIDI